MTLTCKKCNGEMHKTKTIFSSNSKYEFYECKECGNEEQVCRGVTK